MIEGVLYVVATPIGHLDDITLRALTTLKQVDYIAAEDTRHSRHLLHYHNIHTPLISYHDHSTPLAVQRIINKLSAGQSVALICDAGTPLISDPGYRLICAAHERQIAVSPIAGASALTAALSVAGLPCDRFVFEGFVPAKSGERLKYLTTLRLEERTMIFYEAPHRIHSCLVDMCQVFAADRQAVLARELTKQYETIRRAPLDELAQWVSTTPAQRKGEIVLIIAGASADEHRMRREQLGADVLAQLGAVLPHSQAVTLAARLSAASKNALYRKK